MEYTSHSFKQVFYTNFRLMLVVGLYVAFAALAAAKDPVALPPPEKYTLDYPVAEQFCPPIRSTFYEVTQTMMTVGGHKFRQKQNGGYGLPVDIVIDGKNMLHVGADLGWYQVNEPVFAVANGIVRASIGPEFAPEKKNKTKQNASAQAKQGDGAEMQWGNLVVIEHKMRDGTYVTTLYGHLATKRLVKTGDIVQAGQQIGTIGRKHLRINGGYNPHVHFGVRKGRALEKGVAMLYLKPLLGAKAAISIVDFDETEVEFAFQEGVSAQLEIQTLAGIKKLTERDGKYYLPTSSLWGFQRPDFLLVGYELTTDGWHDPIEFLKSQAADTRPAPFRPPQSTPKARPERK